MLLNAIRLFEASCLISEQQLVGGGKNIFVKCAGLDRKDFKCTFIEDSASIHVEEAQP